MRSALGLVVVALAVGAALTFLPMLTPLVLAAWAAHLLRGAFVRISRRLHGRQRAAGLLTAGLVVLIAAPLVLGAVALVPAVRALLEEIRTASGGRGMLATLVSGNAAGGSGPQLVDVIRQYGANASRFASVVAGASATALVAVFVFFATFFSLLVDGERLYKWILDNAPLEETATRRLAGAFHQAGRGLLVGNGLTALVQGALATAAYLALGVPRAALLGVLSVVGALLPMVGTAIVWVPVAAGLALTGHPVRAIILVAIGVGVIATVDNLLRPWLSGRANVGLPASVVLVAILGGVAAFGPWGLLLGPLVVRLAAESVAIMRERIPRAL